MSALPFIAIDGMGGDAAPGIVIDGLEMALEHQPEVRFLIFGDEGKRVHRTAAALR